MTQHKKHGTRHTAAVHHGHHRKPVKAHRAPPAPPDPPKPANAHYVPINKDPAHGAEFEYAWAAGGCFNPACTQRDVSINTPGWVENNIVRVNIAEIAILRGMRFHKLVAPQFTAFFKAVAAKGLGAHIISYDGAFVPRTLTNHANVRSNHAFGSAVDISASKNQYGGTPAARGTRGSLCELADFCADFGLYWGGWYSGHKDAMHFEAVRVLEAAELTRVCATFGVDYHSLPDSLTSHSGASLPRNVPAAGAAPRGALTRAMGERAGPRAYLAAATALVLATAVALCTELLSPRLVLPLRAYAALYNLHVSGGLVLLAAPLFAPVLVAALAPRRLGVDALRAPWLASVALVACVVTALMAVPVAVAPGLFPALVGPLACWATMAIAVGAGSAVVVATLVPRLRDATRPPMPLFAVGVLAASVAQLLLLAYAVVGFVGAALSSDTEALRVVVASDLASYRGLVFPLVAGPSIGLVSDLLGERIADGSPPRGTLAVLTVLLTVVPIVGGLWEVAVLLSVFKLLAEWRHASVRAARPATPASVYVVGVASSLLAAAGLRAILAAIPAQVPMGDTVVVVARLHYSVAVGLFATAAAMFADREDAPDVARLHRRAAMAVVAGAHLAFAMEVVLGFGGMPRGFTSYLPELRSRQIASTVGAYVLAAGVALHAVAWMRARYGKTSA